jgi:hypothetical protein
MRIIGICLIIFSHIGFAQNDTVYVSTVGERFYINTNAQFDKFVVLQITDSASAIKTLQYFKCACASGKIVHQLMFNLLTRQLYRDYTSDQCIVVFTPRTRTFMLNQPFYLKDSKDLIYELLDEKPESEDYTSVRVLLCPKTEGEKVIYIKTKDGLVKPFAGKIAP